MSGVSEKIDKIKVAVRVRPLNRREIDLKTPVIVDMDNGQTILYHSTSNNLKEDKSSLPKKTFAFDECFWSIDPNNDKFSGQEKVFERLGVDVIENAFSGYNACIFAYGQTGSGKSYTMLGTPSQPGIIPRLCNHLFEEIARRQNKDTSYKVEVSYMEIYNEKVRDLLDAQGFSTHNNNQDQRKALRVREHNILGPYVDGLSQLVVNCLVDIEKLMNEGNKSRTVAATNMNTESSRSHAVFNIILTETLVDPSINVSGEKMSKISLVDLAGSERTQKTGAVGERLREGCNINKSLTTLMQVISALASASSAPTSGKENRPKGKSVGGGGSSKTPFVPYRDSTLTWLLKDNLGGNSKTVMVATLSPAADNYEETLSTLRYADNAKRIVNHAVVNEDPNAKIIRELREQVEGLKRELETAKEMQAPELKEKLEESEHIIQKLSKTWEEKLVETERKHKERQEALEKMGISVETSGIKVEKSKYYLVNLNADPSLNEMLVYYLKDKTAVGRGSDQDIKLHGILIQENHCILELIDEEVFLIPLENARSLLNGNQIIEKTKVNNNDRILWGKHHLFRINCPKKLVVPTESDNMNVSNDDVLRSEEYELANEEVMRAELANDPMQQAILDLEKHLMAEKEEALNQQKKEFERQLEHLKGQLSLDIVDKKSSSLENQPDTNNVSTESAATSPLSANESNLMSMSQYTDSMMHLPPAFGSSFLSAAQIAQHQQQQHLQNQMNQDNNDSFWPSSIAMPSWMGSQTNLFATPNNIQLVQARYQTWVENKERSLSLMLSKLREQLAKSNSLTREANFIADEMAKATEYSVTLQIPAASLNPNGRSGGIISEPAILVKRDNKANQIWSLEKLENKVIEMRELYEDWKDTSCPNRMPLGNPFNQSDTNATGEEIIKDDPFFDAQENHSLIGVANIYLSCLFQKVKFRYQVPIINQQGEISGKLAVELSVVNGELPDITPRDASSVGMATSIYNQSMTSSVYSSFGVYNNNTNNNNMVTSSNSQTEAVDDTNYPSRSTSGYSLGSSVTIRIRVIQATHLPEELSHFVFCQYSFWGSNHPTVVPPALQPDYRNMNNTTNNNPANQSANEQQVNSNLARTTTFKFNHSNDYHIYLTDEILEQLADGALSIEVFGNRSPGFTGYQSANSVMTMQGVYKTNELNASMIQSQKTNYSDDKESRSTVSSRKFGDRWMELYRRLEFWVCIEELNEQGEYQKVELAPNTMNNNNDIATGGVFQLRHGHSKRIRVFVRPNKVSRGCRGSLPLICDQIEEISVGDIICTKRGQNMDSDDSTPDSYQEEDLVRLRGAWSRAVNMRQEYLKEQLQKVSESNVTDQQRESALMNQWLRLTEERDAVLVPAPGSGIPGAPATWSPVVGMEKHCPVIFLDIDNAEINNAGAAAISDPGPVPCAIDHHGNVTVMSGGNCLLPGSNTEAHYLVLPIVKRYENLCGAVAQWDASLHDSIILNRVTDNNDRVYLTVKVVVRLNHPALVDLVLRKRICIHIYKKQGFTSFLKKQWTRYKNETHPIWSGVTYQIVSGIPQNSLEFEDRETLAQLAATNSESCVSSTDQESYIQKYIRTVSTVESLMEVDKIRQEVACQEIVAQMRRQRRSLVPGVLGYIPVDPTNRRMPIIGNPNYIGHPTANNIVLNNPDAALTANRSFNQHPAIMGVADPNMGGIKKYISVPDFQQMYRSSSLTNLNGLMSPDQNTNNVTKQGSDITDFESAKSGSISNLSKLIDNSTNVTCVSPTKTNTQTNNTLPIKPALVPRRPQPPKNLLNRQAVSVYRPHRWSMIVLGKTAHLPGVIPIPNTNPTVHSNKQQTTPINDPINDSNNNNVSSHQPATIETTTSSLTTTTNVATVTSSKSLSHSATEDSLTRSKSSGYGSSQTVSSSIHKQQLHITQQPQNNNNNNNNQSYNGNSVTTPLVTIINGTSNDNDYSQVIKSLSVNKVSTIVNGEKVWGSVKFINTVPQHDGLWVGIELDEMKGTNNGTMDGVKYFTCSSNHGLFVRPDNVFVDM